MDDDDPVAVLQRWEGSGGVWRVARRDGERLDIRLLTCSGDEEMGRVTSSDPALRAFVGAREASDG